MSLYEVDTKVKELRELRDLEAEVKADIAAIEDALKAEMLEKNTEVLAGKDYLITGKTLLRIVLTAQLLSWLTQISSVSSAAVPPRGGLLSRRGKKYENCTGGAKEEGGGAEH